MKNVYDLIEELRSLKQLNTLEAYDRIKKVLYEYSIPINVVEHNPFKIIRYRRHNNGEEIFNNVSELSYRIDLEKITNFGRCNEPKQGFFYCADNRNEVAGISELVTVFRGEENSEDEILTVGAWKVKNPLLLAMILPPVSKRGLNPEFNQMALFYDKFNEDFFDFQAMRPLVEFLAKEFTLDTTRDNSNYLLTAAFTNYVKDKAPNLDGLMYASVKAELKDTNIVLFPNAVDTKLEFEAARKRGFKRVPRSKSFIEIETKDSTSVNLDNGKISWN